MSHGNRNRPNPIFGVVSLLIGGVIGYAWKGTFLSFWLGGIVGFSIVGILWAFIPPLLQVFNKRNIFSKTNNGTTEHWAPMNNESNLMAQEYDFFMSYKSEDANFVRVIADKLIANGLRIWFSEYMILLTERDKFQELIDDNIKRSKYGLVFTNDRFAQSPYCHLEIEQLLHPDNCGPDRIIEIKIPKENLPHTKYRALAKSQSMAYDFNKHTAKDVLKFIKSASPFSIKDIEYIPPPKKVSEYSDSIVGYCLNIHGWEIFKKGTSEIDRLGNINGPILVQRLGKHKIAANLTIGPVSTHEKEAIPFPNHKSQIEAVRRALKTIQKNDPKYNRVREPEDDRKIYAQAIDFAEDYSRKVKLNIVGVHLFHFGGYAHFAITYIKDNLWTRRYAIVLTDPETKIGFEFTFVFAYDGVFENFCKYAYRMENLLNSLDIVKSTLNLPDQTVEELYGLGNKNIQMGNYETAARYYEKAVEIDFENNADFFIKLGNNILRMGYPEIADKCFKKAREIG